MRLKIIHLTQFLGVGGLEKVLFHLINEQIQAGHEVELVVYDYEQSWVEYFRSSGIKVDTSYRKRNGYDLNLIKFLSNKIKKFDILHTHDLNPLMYASPLKLGHQITNKKFPKLIHTAHGMDHLNKRPITKLYEKICSYSVDKTIGVSSAICDYYLSLGVSKEKLLNINNGTNLTKYPEQSIHATKEKVRRELGLNKEIIIWSCVARIVPLKDQQIICSLAKKLPKHIFLLIGPSGNNEYWDRIEKTKPDNVLMLGAREDISELLLSSDYFISASRHEGIPISVLEAGALKIPCLLSDIPGHKLIQSKAIQSVGIYFEVGNLEDLIEKAIALSNDKNLSRTLGLSLYQNVRENFSSNAMYNQYQEAYLN